MTATRVRPMGARNGRRVVLGVTIFLLYACSPRDLVGTGDLPSNLSDPAATRTPAGALQAYRGVLTQLRGASSEFVLETGLLGDELQSGDVVGNGSVIGTSFGLDPRILPEFTDAALEDQHNTYVSLYAALQKVRGQGYEALGLLRDYAPNGAAASRGHVYAVMGYSEVMLAELYCSGIPLSTLDYDGDYTLKPASSTIDVIDHARALFDSALTLAADSDRIVNLARVGEGRALLDRGDFAGAAAAVVNVPDGFTYQLSFTASISLDKATNFALVNPGQAWDQTVSDNEGVNGLPYRSRGDLRTASDAIGPNVNGATLYHPNKYATDGSSSIVLADGIEARLIEAEAALKANDVPSWLGKLNHLRETAISPALPDTLDPGTADGRVDLLFRERAFWLFLTGHREGDLRRLIRQYGRSQSQVYPVGHYPAGSSSYGSDVNAPIPALERVGNPLFHGCLGRGA